MGANLTNANLNSSTLTNTNLTSADLRGARGLLQAGATLHNTILPDGTISGLYLSAGERLVVHDYHGDPARQLGPVTIHVREGMTVTQGGSLELVFQHVDWQSPINFSSEIPILLDGTLKLNFFSHVDPASQFGRTIRVFDWSGVNPVGEFEIVSAFVWDLSDLYTTGEITLRLPGDANDDGFVNHADLTILTQNYGLSAAAEWPDGDFNQDGRVNLADLALLKRHFGEAAAMRNADLMTLPEPRASLLAFMAGFSGWSILRRRKGSRCMPPPNCEHPSV
jgi:hypothetical protein